MATDIEVRRLINFETATDGTAVRLLVDDAAGRTVGIIFTIETLSALLMTLPTMAASAIKRAHNDPTMRITYPATDFQIELSPGNVRILTIGTLCLSAIKLCLARRLERIASREPRFLPSNQTRLVTSKI